jgi:VIT1/CCC1 family predicted Fe2+/Mn2+ transporter
MVPEAFVSRVVIGTALVLLAVLGALAARIGGASLLRGALRVAFWGALAMSISALVGRLFGTTV